jgi:hypothetical protein
MTHTEALLILEAMADGCSPLTGEVLPHDHLLLDESVMEAILIALEVLRAAPATGAGASGKSTRAASKVAKPDLTAVDVVLPEDDLWAAVELYRALAINPTANRIAALLCGTPAVKEDEIKRHPLFGKYGGRYQKAQIVPWLEEWSKLHNVIPSRENTKELHPYFAEPHFNKLSPPAIAQLKAKVEAIPIVKLEGLSDDLVERRKTLPRSHEPWPEEELRLLKKATEFTNDLEFLMQCFGRSALALSAQAEKWLPMEDADVAP